MIGGLLVVAGFAAVDPDISLSREDQDKKQAYGAAESGLQWYLNSLSKDNNYYLKCTPGPSAAERHRGRAREPDVWTGTGMRARVRRKLPGEKALVTPVELLPAPGKSRGATPRGAVLDGGPVREHAHPRHRALARRVPERHRDPAAAQLHRLHLLHRLRDARPGGVQQSRHDGRRAARATAPAARGWAAPRSSSPTTTTVFGAVPHERQRPHLRAPHPSGGPSATQ